jgi:hypothetical protein
MEDQDDRIIKLKSKDEQVFELTADAASISDLVRDSLTDAEDDDPIEILRVSSDCLQKVVEFLKHYKEENMKEIPTPLGGSSFNEVRAKNAGLYEPFYTTGTFVFCKSRESLLVLERTLLIPSHFLRVIDYGPKVVPGLCCG